MIIADTNVLSEPLRQRPDATALAWLEAAGPDLALTTVTVTELLFGALRLPQGRRRADLITAIERLIDDAGDRVLDFDEAAARACATLRADREKAGRPVSIEDFMIGAVCLARGLPLATRNVGDFEGFGITIVNPWENGPLPAA